MLQIIISGTTNEELLASANSVVALLGGTSGKSVLSASDQARLRGDATVVPPSGKGGDASSTSKDKTTAEKKAAKKAAEEAAKKAAEAEIDGGEPDTSADDDALGETDGDAEALTMDDVKKLLVEVRGAYPKKTTIISEIVKEYGKAAKLSEVDDKNLPKVAAQCRKLLKDAGQ